MEPRTLIIIAIVVVVIIVAYVLISSHGSGSKSTTTVTGGEINGTTSMTIPPYITTYNALASNNFTNITGVDIKIQYTGPAEVKRQEGYLYFIGQVQDMRLNKNVH